MEKDYLPPLLLDALGGGKRPNQQSSSFFQYSQQRTGSRSRSKSRESKSSTILQDEDAPPPTSQFNQSPTREVPKLKFLNDNSSTHQSPNSMMSMDSPNQNTPTSSLKNSITCLGIPPKKVDFVVNEFMKIGPISNVQKRENFVVISFLKPEDAQEALLMDNTLYRDWILVVKQGDLLNSIQTCQQSGNDSPSRVVMESSLSKNESPESFATPIRPKSPFFYDTLQQSKESPLTVGSIYPTVSTGSEGVIKAETQILIGQVQSPSLIHRLYYKLSDLLFGW
jgi:hypothetical protein